MFNFEYGSLALKDLAVETAEQPRSRKKYVKTVLVRGEPLTPSKRFWTSLQIHFRFSENVFNYFSHEEVFERIAQRYPDNRLRYCVQRDDDGHGTLLAVTGLNKAAIHHDNLMDILQQYHAENVAYA